ncbi:MAG: CoA transferase [Alphaproteobacteria bacterium]|nr:CoA transferase [Alphaproteobacteria bacterium]
MQPLAGLKILDFSTLLPGPLATLILAEAGAEVLKIERPGSGDDMRSFPPFVEGESALFALLNRGKKSLALDLKSTDVWTTLEPLIRDADVLVEQFRPGVMERLGLDYARSSAINPRLIYCSITGYGQTGPKANVVGHDLTYLAEAGVLSQARLGAVPPVLAADIAGGAYPAVMNILLALRQRDATGKGAYLDIAMAEQSLTFAVGGLAELFATGKAPGPADWLLTGGSPRYQVYPTSDGQWLAAAPLEQKFWQRFCELIELPAEFRDDRRDRHATRDAVAKRIAAKPASHWRSLFDGEDVSCAIVATLEEAALDPQITARSVLSHRLAVAGREMPAFPIPVAPTFRQAPSVGKAPKLGERT